MTELKKPDKRTVDGFRKAMLGWYDAHWRKMPWRSPPQTRPDPYHDWLSEVMLQQTTVPTVMRYFTRFIELWPTVEDLAAAPVEDVMHEWAGLGYYARARNLHKCAKVIASEHGGVFPADIEALKKLPGIGDYTANAIAAIAFDQPSIVVDGNIERVMARVFDIQTPLPAAKKDIKIAAGYMAGGRTDRPGDYAQSLMDLGAMICTPAKPACGLCPVARYCKARKLGVAEQLPRRAPKKDKPVKYGHLYWIEDARGRVLLERRPESVMLGGMAGLPTSEWSELPPETNDNARILGQIRHSFTHFDLYLDIVKRPVPKTYDGWWVERAALPGAGLPTLFAKAVKLLIQKEI